MKNDTKKTASPGPLMPSLHAADRKRLEAYASAFGVPPATVAAELVRDILRSLPPPPEKPQTSFSDFLAGEVTNARKTTAALLKAAASVDSAADRTAKVIDLLEPAMHRLLPHG